MAKMVDAGLRECYAVGERFHTCGPVREQSISGLSEGGRRGRCDQDEVPVQLEGKDAAQP